MTAVLFLESNHSPANNTRGSLQQTGAAQGVAEAPLLFPPSQPGARVPLCRVAATCPVPTSFRLYSVQVLQFSEQCQCLM